MESNTDTDDFGDLSDSDLLAELGNDLIQEDSESLGKPDLVNPAIQGSEGHSIFITQPSATPVTVPMGSSKVGQIKFKGVMVLIV